MKGRVFESMGVEGGGREGCNLSNESSIVREKILNITFQNWKDDLEKAQPGCHFLHRILQRHDDARSCASSAGA